MTEIEFKALAAQGYNRIPLLAEALADLDTPLGLYLKLTDPADRANTFLLESVVGGERFGRYSFIGLPARTVVRSRGERIEVVRDGSRRRDGRGRSARIRAPVQGALQGGDEAGHAAFLRRPCRLPRLRPRQVHRAEDRQGREAGPGGRAGPAADAGGRTGHHRQPQQHALPARLRGSDAARGVRQGAQPASRPSRAAGGAGDSPGGACAAAGGEAGRVDPDRATIRQGRLPRDSAQGEGAHRGRRPDAGADRAGAAQEVPAFAALAVPGAAHDQPVAVHVLLRLRRLSRDRRIAGDPRAPRHGATADGHACGRSPAPASAA